MSIESGELLHGLPNILQHSSNEVKYCNENTSIESGATIRFLLEMLQSGEILLGKDVDRIKIHHFLLDILQRSSKKNDAKYYIANTFIESGKIQYFLLDILQCLKSQLSYSFSFHHPEET